MSKKTINLALQGGGSHGAFTWGVLDALLEDGRIDFEGVSATSAGAMNAAILAYGKTDRRRGWCAPSLRRFLAGCFPDQRGFQAPRTQSPFSPLCKACGATSRPIQFNPFNVNPLKDVLERNIHDMDEIHKCECVKLFITATNVHSGTATVFQNKDVTIDALLASACLPHLFQAVEIKGEAYWDGGYMGNPSLWPLFYNAGCRDILLVHINPISRADIPETAEEIENRLNEITFNRRAPQRAALGSILLKS